MQTAQSSGLTQEPVAPPNSPPHSSSFWLKLPSPLREPQSSSCRMGEISNATAQLYLQEEYPLRGLPVPMRVPGGEKPCRQVPGDQEAEGQIGPKQCPAEAPPSSCPQAFFPPSFFSNRMHSNQLAFFNKLKDDISRGHGEGLHSLFLVRLRNKTAKYVTCECQFSFSFFSLQT